MRILFSFLLSVTSLCLLAQDYNEQFAVANNAYRDGDYAAALEKYEAIEAVGLRSAELYYNIANTHYRQETLGKAILYYERALELAPNDEDIQNNLAIAREDLQDEIEALPPFFLRAWWAALRDTLSSSTWAYLAIGILWVGILGLILWQLGKVRSQRKLGFSMGLTLTLLSILPFTLAYSKAQVEVRSGEAIVLEKEVILRYAPEAKSTEIVALHEGTKVQLIDKISTWHKVRLANGEQGWLPEGSFEEI